MSRRPRSRLSRGQFCGQSIVFNVDRGSRFCLVDSNTLTQTGYTADLITVPLPLETCMLPSGFEVSVERAVIAPITFRGNRYKQLFVVLKGLTEATGPHRVEAIIGTDLLFLELFQ